MTTKKDILNALRDVKDPEIPSVSIVDLGIVTGVEVDDGNFVSVTLTPTFAGCPALKMIEDMVSEKLGELKCGGVEVKTTFDIPWNSNMITEHGREMLKKHGLAPPPVHNGDFQLSDFLKIECPHCGSRETEIKTIFGSALCRSIHYCNQCLQSFEQFKPVV